MPRGSKFESETAPFDQIGEITVNVGHPFEAFISFQFYNLKFISYFILTFIFIGLMFSQGKHSRFSMVSFPCHGCSYTQIQIQAYAIGNCSVPIKDYPKVLRT